MRQGGFTYLFVLFMLVLISISLLASRSVEVTEARRDQERVLLAIGHEFRAALASYVQASGGSGSGVNAYPTSLDELLEDHRVPTVRRHLRKLFVDPLTGTSHWGLLYAGGHIVGIYSLAPGKPLKQAGFDGADVGFAGAQRYSDWIFAWPAQATALAPAPTPVN
jgi:type II secretory pathway pseudopilin PulG